MTLKDMISHEKVILDKMMHLKQRKQEAIDEGDYLTAKQIKNSENVLTELGKSIKQQTATRNRKLARGEDTRAIDQLIQD